jgi:hypothetical protein
MELVFKAHSGFRYVVLLAAALAAGYRIALVSRGLAADRPARVLGAVFVGALDLQVTLGLVLLFLFPYYPALIGHIVSMVLALVVAHGLSVMSRRGEGRRQDVLALAGILGPLLLIVAGILAIGRPILG